MWTFVSPGDGSLKFWFNAAVSGRGEIDGQIFPFAPSSPPAVNVTVARGARIDGGTPLKFTERVIAPERINPSAADPSLSSRPRPPRRSRATLKVWKLVQL